MKALASFPGPPSPPTQLPVASSTVLEATGSWAGAWERGYESTILNILEVDSKVCGENGILQ